MSANLYLKPELFKGMGVPKPKPVKQQAPPAAVGIPSGLEGKGERGGRPGSKPDTYASEEEQRDDPIEGASTLEGNAISAGLKPAPQASPVQVAAAPKAPSPPKATPPPQAASIPNPPQPPKLSTLMASLRDPEEQESLVKGLEDLFDKTGEELEKAFSDLLEKHPNHPLAERLSKAVGDSKPPPTTPVQAAPDMGVESPPTTPTTPAQDATPAQAAPDMGVKAPPVKARLPGTETSFAERLSATQGSEALDRPIGEVESKGPLVAEAEGLAPSAATPKPIPNTHVVKFPSKAHGEVHGYAHGPAGSPEIHLKSGNTGETLAKVPASDVMPHPLSPESGGPDKAWKGRKALNIKNIKGEDGNPVFPDAPHDYTPLHEKWDVSHEEDGGLHHHKPGGAPLSPGHAKAIARQAPQPGDSTELGDHKTFENALGDIHQRLENGQEVVVPHGTAHGQEITDAVMGNPATYHHSIDTSEAGKPKLVISAVHSSAHAGSDDGWLGPQAEEAGEIAGEKARYDQLSSEDQHKMVRDLVAEAGYASTTHVQRKLRLPFNEAQGHINKLEADGHVGPLAGEEGETPSREVHMPPPSDKEAHADYWKQDTDGDGVPDADDALPQDPTESVDTDGDGIGDNAQADAGALGGVGFEQLSDRDLGTEKRRISAEGMELRRQKLASEDPEEISRLEGEIADSMKEHATLGQEVKRRFSQKNDVDGDGVPDTEDALPEDPTESVDTDGDGIGDVADPEPDVPEPEVVEPGVETEPGVPPKEGVPPETREKIDAWTEKIRKQKEARDAERRGVEPPSPEEVPVGEPAPEPGVETGAPAEEPLSEEGRRRQLFHPSGRELTPHEMVAAQEIRKETGRAPTDAEMDAAQEAIRQEDTPFSQAEKEGRAPTPHERIGKIVENENVPPDLREVMRLLPEKDADWSQKAAYIRRVMQKLAEHRNKSKNKADWYKLGQSLMTPDPFAALENWFGAFGQVLRGFEEGFEDHISARKAKKALQERLGMRVPSEISKKTSKILKDDEFGHGDIAKTVGNTTHWTKDNHEGFHRDHAALKEAFERDKGKYSDADLKHTYAHLFDFVARKHRTLANASNGYYHVHKTPTKQDNSKFDQILIAAALDTPFSDKSKLAEIMKQSRKWSRETQSEFSSILNQRLSASPESRAAAIDMAVNKANQLNGLEDAARDLYNQTYPKDKVDKREAYKGAWKSDFFSHLEDLHKELGSLEKVFEKHSNLLEKLKMTAEVLSAREAQRAAKDKAKLDGGAEAEADDIPQAPVAEDTWGDHLPGVTEKNKSLKKFDPKIHPKDNASGERGFKDLKGVSHVITAQGVGEDGKRKFTVRKINPLYNPKAPELHPETITETMNVEDVYTGVENGWYKPSVINWHHHPPGEIRDEEFAKELKDIQGDVEHPTFEDMTQEELAEAGVGGRAHYQGEKRHEQEGKKAFFGKLGWKSNPVHNVGTGFADDRGVVYYIDKHKWSPDGNTDFYEVEFRNIDENGKGFTDRKDIKVDELEGSMAGDWKGVVPEWHPKYTAVEGGKEAAKKKQDDLLRRLRKKQEEGEVEVEVVPSEDPQGFDLDNPEQHLNAKAKLAYDDITADIDHSQNLVGLFGQHASDQKEKGKDWWVPHAYDIEDPDEMKQVWGHVLSNAGLNHNQITAFRNAQQAFTAVKVNALGKYEKEKDKPGAVDRLRGRMVFSSGGYRDFSQILNHIKNNIKGNDLSEEGKFGPVDLLTQENLDEVSKKSGFLPSELKEEFGSDPHTLGSVESARKRGRDVVDEAKAAREDAEGVAGEAEAPEAAPTPEEGVTPADTPTDAEVETTKEAEAAQEKPEAVPKVDPESHTWDTLNKVYGSWKGVQPRERNKAAERQGFKDWSALEDRWGALKPEGAESQDRRSDLDVVKSGKDTPMHSGDMSVPVTHGLVEADMVLPSHRPSGGTFIHNKDVGFPGSAQERTTYAKEGGEGYTEAGKAVLKNAEEFREWTTEDGEVKTKGFNPSRAIDPSASPNLGPPVITKDGIVLGGNSRAMTMKHMYGEGNQGHVIKQYLLDNAEAFGLNREDIEKMRNPMLVRMIPHHSQDLSDDQLKKYSVDLNPQDIKGRTSAEQAASLGDFLGGQAAKLASSFRPELGVGKNKGTHESIQTYLDSPQSKGIKDEFIKQYKETRQEWFVGDKGISPLGAQVLSDAIGSTFLEKIQHAEDLGPDLLDRLNKAALPATVASLVDPKMDLKDEIKLATDAHVAIKKYPDTFAGGDDKYKKDYLNRSSTEHIEGDEMGGALSASDPSDDLFGVAKPDHNILKNPLAQWVYHLMYGKDGGGNRTRHTENLVRDVFNQYLNNIRKTDQEWDFAFNTDASPYEKGPKDVLDNLRRSYQMVTGDDPLEAEKKWGLDSKALEEHVAKRGVKEAPKSGAEAPEEKAAAPKPEEADAPEEAAAEEAEVETSPEDVTGLISDLKDLRSKDINEEIEDWRGNLLTTLKAYEKMAKKKPEEAKEYLQSIKESEHWKNYEKHLQAEAPEPEEAAPEEAPEPGEAVRSWAARRSLATAITNKMHDRWREGFQADKGADAERYKPVPHEGDAEDAFKDLSESYKKLRLNDGVLEQDINQSAEAIVPSLAHKLNGAPATDYSAAIHDAGKVSSETHAHDLASDFHEVWKKHNEWQKDSNPELFKDYKDLPNDEKAKDLDQVAVGIEEHYGSDSKELALVNSAKSKLMGTPEPEAVAPEEAAAPEPEGEAPKPEETLGLTKQGRYFYPTDADGNADTGQSPVHAVTIGDDTVHVTSTEIGGVGKVWHAYDPDVADPLKEGMTTAFTMKDLEKKLAEEAAAPEPEETTAPEKAASYEKPHDQAVSREEMDPKARYSMWEKRGDTWNIDRSYGGNFLSGDDAQWEGQGPKQVSEGRTSAFFPEGLDPNQKAAAPEPEGEIPEEHKAVSVEDVEPMDKAAQDADKELGKELLEKDGVDSTDTDDLLACLKAAKGGEGA